MHVFPSLYFLHFPHVFLIFLFYLAPPKLSTNYSFLNFDFFVTVHLVIWFLSSIRLLKTFLYLACTNMWVSGNESSMPRFVYAFVVRVRAREESVAVLHSTREHVSQFGPSRGERVHKYCAYCSSVKSLLTYIVFQLYLQPAHLRSTRTHTASRSAIMFLAEKAAPPFFL